MPKISEVVGKLAEQKGYNIKTISNELKIAEWTSWYKGNVDKFHTYKAVVNGKEQSFNRTSMQTSKMVAEDWASILWSEFVKMMWVEPSDTLTETAKLNILQRLFRVIKKDKEKLDINKSVAAILEKNNFRVMFGQGIEMAFAQSEHMVVTYKEGLETKINFINVEDYIVMDQWNGRIQSVAVWTERIIKGVKMMLITLHISVEGSYVIENRYFRIIRKGYISAIAEPMANVDPDLLEVIIYPNTEPFFEVIKPNVANNQDLRNVRGIAINANATDIQKSIDKAQTSMDWDIESGETKVLVTSKVVAKDFDAETGEYTNNFDIRNRVFMVADGIEESPVNVIQPEIRSEDHIAVLNNNYMLFGKKCGLGKEFYNFKEGKVYKNIEELISTKSELWTNKVKHEQILAKNLKGIWNAILTLNGWSTEGFLDIKFDDSLIRDAKSEKAEDKQDMMDGVITKEEYILKWNDKISTIEEAEEYVQVLNRRGIVTDPELLGIE